jgi:pantoate--beta-alanine ligase
LRAVPAGRARAPVPTGASIGAPFPFARARVTVVTPAHPSGEAIVFESAMAMQEQAIAWRTAGDEIGLVPTMGALHAGHESLVTRARQENHRVVVSIFVNPTQFAPTEDFANYPRPFEQDRARLEALGVDAIFHPPVDQIYPPAFKTGINPGPLAEVLEGNIRPGHFAGVLTVVLKLLELTQPKRAYFGQKDFQQLVLVRQLVRDFALPVRIVAMPTVRDPDGLALSSRNAYLTAAERALAPAVHAAIVAAASQFDAGVRDPSELEAAARRRMEGTPGMTVQYVAVVEDTTLSRPKRAIPGSVLAVAVKLGSIRLIDNVVLGAGRL